MKEQESRSQFVSQQSQSVSQHPHLEQISQVPSFVFIIAGLYFLAFAIAQLITNYKENRYSAEFSCTDYVCTCFVQAASFSQETVYLYLTSSLAQNLLQNDDNQITGCNHLSTNGLMGKTTSLSSTALDASASAYPCGQVSQSYLGPVMQIKNTEAGTYLTVLDTDLVLDDQLYQNKNISEQWTDVEDPRFKVWMEVDHALGLMKYWGKINQKVSSDLEITITSTNPVTEDIKASLGILLTNNKALSGYNTALCVSNFGWASVMIAMGLLSFATISARKMKMGTGEFSQHQSTLVTRTNQ